MECIIDDEDWEKIKDYHWHVSCGYARTGKKRILMHRLIMNALDCNLEIDHINRNKLHNRKINLRACSHKENSMNVTKSKGTSSKYKGVYLDKRINKTYIRSGVKIDGIRKHIGYYNTEIEAAIAYDVEAKKIFGEFANLNFKEKVT